MLVMECNADPRTLAPLYLYGAMDISVIDEVHGEPSAYQKLCGGYWLPCPSATFMKKQIGEGRQLLSSPMVEKASLEAENVLDYSSMRRKRWEMGSWCPVCTAG